MGFLRDLFSDVTGGDTRVLSAKNPEIQEVLTYMNNQYGAYIESMTYNGEKNYYLRCTDKHLFNLLYENGLYNSAGHVVVPGKRGIYRSKTEAYEDLVWLYNFLEEHFANQRRDEEWF